jgi:hypothetical protein
VVELGRLDNQSVASTANTESSADIPCGQRAAGQSTVSPATGLPNQVTSDSIADTEHAESTNQIVLLSQSQLQPLTIESQPSMSLKLTDEPAGARADFTEAPLREARTIHAASLEEQSDALGVMPNRVPAVPHVAWLTRDKRHSSSVSRCVP